MVIKTFSGFFEDKPTFKNDWWMCAYFPITISSLNHSVSLVTCCKNRLSENLVVEVVRFTRCQHMKWQHGQGFFGRSKNSSKKVSKLNTQEKTKVNPNTQYSKRSESSNPAEKQ